ncbi:MAG: hypothetical protein EOO73_02860 [Myxococcales bacterium]|nr:MAG: hypothetical protein EOO73_02860 [Myxococcales bacterium]
MPCQILTTRGAVFVLWGQPLPADMDEVQAAVEAAAAACGHPVVYVTRVPVNAPAPDAGARARLNEVMPSLMKACSTYHVVLEGEGFGAAMKRGILTGVFQLSWRRKTFFVHADTSEVAPALSDERRATVRHLLVTAERRGLLGAPAAVGL